MEQRTKIPDRIHASLRGLWGKFGAGRYLFLGLSLVCLAVFFIWKFQQRMDTAVESGRTSLQKEILVPFEILNPATAQESFGEWLPLRSRILSLLIREEEVLVGATDGLHVFDREGRHQSWQKPTQALGPGDITAITRHQNLTVMAVSGQGLLFSGQNPYLARPLDAFCREITALLSAPQGDLWLGTRETGLLLWRKDRFERAFIDEFHGKNITALAGDSLDLWVGTYDNGAMHFSQGGWKRIGRQEGLPDDQVTQISIGSDGVVWIGTPLGIAAWQADRIQGRLIEGEFASSLASAGDQVYAGTLEGKVYALTSTRRATPVSAWDADNPANPDTRMILAAGSGEILAANGPNAWGLSRSGGHAVWKLFLSLPPAEGAALNDRNISSLATDSQGRLWVGYFDNGLDVVNWAQGRTDHYRDDALFCVNHIRYDPQKGETYVATANGLVIFNSTSGYRVLRKEDGLPHDYVSQTAAETSPANTFYAGTAAGLAIFDSRSIRSVQTLHGLASNRVYSIASVAGSLYIGTLGGLSRLSGQLDIRNYNRGNSELRHDWVNAVLQVGEDVWIGTYGGGIQVLKHDSTWRDPLVSSRGLHINPGAMFKMGNLVFAGSLEAGFLIVRTDDLAGAEIRSGLPSLNVTSFAADESYLYVGTDRGLMRYRQSDLGSILESQARR